ncbi:hypothetical protein [Hyphomicrobium sp.]|uniref:hypothetical protein n=1 Tax=Hyphomicrobium sp. TaxID=82 RepID=UPI002D78A45C|nr:hypothetical protein [Hyphomicrobium sp.]HET6388863.1 hypothetical protein [Hyphomicrobium sp.]
MLTLLVINVFALIILEAALLYRLRAILARVPLSNWNRQAVFVIASVLLFTPAVMPAGIGLALFVPNVVFLAFAASPELLHWYGITASLFVPFMFVTAAVSWWLGANVFLTATEHAETGEP